MDSKTLTDLLIAIGALFGTGGLTAFLKVMYDKKLEKRREKNVTKLAKEAMIHDKQDASKIFSNYLRYEERKTKQSKTKDT